MKRAQPRGPRRRLSDVLCDDGGSGMVEVALSLPVLLMMMFGFINFALMVFGVCNATWASRTAVRYACLHSSTSYAPAATQDVINVVTPLLGAYPQSSQSVGVKYSGGNVVGSTVTVSVALTYRVSVPWSPTTTVPVNIQASGVVVQ